MIDHEAKRDCHVSSTCLLQKKSSSTYGIQSMPFVSFLILFFRRPEFRRDNLLDFYDENIFLTLTPLFAFPCWIKIVIDTFRNPCYNG